jgi:hypothetical protein
LLILIKDKGNIVLWEINPIKGTMTPAQEKAFVERQAEEANIYFV